MVDIKKLKWSNLGHPMVGKRHVTPEELVWLAEQGLYPRPDKIKKEKLIKVQKSEADIARQYAKIIMDKQRTRGMVSNKFEDLKSKTTINKDLWLDTDFFFSVVFQSREQKNAFLIFLEEKVKIDFDYSNEHKIQIINGLKLAEQLGCPLKKEIADDYPCGNIDLKSFILDEERK